MKAVVIGATGQIGRVLVSLLLAHGFEVTAVIRTLPADPQKFFSASDENITRLALSVEADFTDCDFSSVFGARPFTHAFSTLGTTRNASSSFSEYYRVDHDYALSFARAARENNVRVFSIVTSMGASSSSSFSYLKLKGDVERDITALGFPALVICRPGVLVARQVRPHAPWYEYVMQKLLCPIIDYIFPGRYAVPVDAVAKAMVLSAIKAAEQTPSATVLENKDIIALASGSPWPTE